MKNLIIFSVCLISLASLTACKTTMQDGPTSVTVEDDYHENGDFCPPGQAKKGNC